MGIDAAISVILVQDEVKSFRAIAGLALIPLHGCRLELRHQKLAHCLRGGGRCGACLQLFLMPVAAEEYSAGACVRGHLQRVIQACSMGHLSLWT